MIKFETFEFEFGSKDLKFGIHIEDSKLVKRGEEVQNRWQFFTLVLGRNSFILDCLILMFYACCNTRNQTLSLLNLYHLVLK